MTVQLTPEARAACERLGADPDAVAENIAAHLRTAPTCEERSVTISVDGDIIPHALSRSDVLAEARRALLSGRILIRSEVDFGVDLSRYFGPSIMDGDRGCFHDGCDAAVAQEGGSHWCKLVRWGPLVPLVPPPTPATPG